MNALADRTGHNFRIVTPSFQLPVIRGLIDRRLLVNFRCDPEILGRLVPPPFRLKRIGAFGMAGICLIRLGRVGPRWLPGPFGLTSENAAHRIAVEWDAAGERREGVFIPRRDTNSRLNELAGGRLFPGVHHHATFQVWESPNRYKIELNSDDGQTQVRVAARLADSWPGGSVFASLNEASEFFRAGSLGWSSRSNGSSFDGLELHVPMWKMDSLITERIESSFFDNRALFPQGTADYDSAFLMRRVEHEWRGRGRMTCHRT